jgi:SAM-dependent methyltransferase
VSKLNKNGTSPFDSLATEYDAWFEKEGKAIFTVEVQALKSILPLLVKPWLEIGVGSGRFAQALGIETGIDPSARLLALAERRGITVFQARGEQEFFSRETFGTVFLIVTMCFVASPLAVLKEAHRILKPEGKAVLGLVLRESPWGEFYRRKKYQGHRFYKHATFYSYQEVEEMLMDSGFAIEKIVSTLFQEPERVREIEIPKNGYFASAGFTILVAGKH